MEWQKLRLGRVCQTVPEYGDALLLPRNPARVRRGLVASSGGSETRWRDLQDLPCESAWTKVVFECAQLHLRGDAAAEMEKLYVEIICLSFSPGGFRVGWMNLVDRTFGLWLDMRFGRQAEYLLGSAHCP
nr:hypothetical protein CFP56_31473 [Quercus suber]